MGKYAPRQLWSMAQSISEVWTNIFTQSTARQAKRYGDSQQKVKYAPRLLWLTEWSTSEVMGDGFTP